MFRKIIVIFTLLSVVCEIRSNRVKRVVGGEVSKPEKFPYQVSLEISGNSNCSASIVSSEWAITSAFCVSGISPEAITLRAGSNIKNKGGTIHKVKKLIINPRYVPKTYEFDYALINVQEPFPIGTPTVDKILLAWDEPIDRDLAVVSGWGVLNKLYGNETNELHDVNVPILNRAICEGVYYGILPITRSMICAGYSEGGRDPCKGDFGGPLVIGDAQYGIVSQTFCGQPNRPAVYSNIPYERFWIRNTAGI